MLATVESIPPGSNYNVLKDSRGVHRNVGFDMLVPNSIKWYDLNISNIVYNINQLKYYLHYMFRHLYVASCSRHKSNHIVIVPRRARSLYPSAVVVIAMWMLGLRRRLAAFSFIESQGEGI